MNDRRNDDAPRQAIEALVAECLERQALSGSSAVDDICRAHPDEAGEVRACLELLDGLGLGGDGLGASRDGLPEFMGDYRLVRRLGGGGMGVVYLAEQESTGREVALKIVRPEYTFFGQARERFRREIEAVSLLSHPSIVSVDDVGEHDSVPFLVMERIYGCTLADVLAAVAGRDPSRLDGAALRRTVQQVSESDTSGDGGGLYDGSWAETSLRIAREVALALDHAQDKGVLHRDVKPSNVMITAGGRVLLIDFGLAQAEDATRITRTGSALGSQPYMAPERVRGSDQADRRADIYGLGVTLYEMLTLQLPFPARQAEAVRQLILAGQPAPPRGLNPGVSVEAETVCLAAMDLDPRRRYATGADFARDLDNVLRRRPIVARRPGRVLRARRWRHQHPIVSLVIGFTILLVVGALWFGFEQRALRRQADEARALADHEANTARTMVAFLSGLFEGTDPSLAGGPPSTAMDLLERGARMVESGLGNRPALQARFSSIIGDLYRRLGDHEKALAFIEQGLVLREDAEGSGGLSLADSLLTLGRLHVSAGRPDKAVDVFQRAFDIRKGHLGAGHAATVEARYELQVAHLANLSGPPHVIEIEEILALRRQLHGDESREVIETLNLLARILVGGGKVEYADRVLQEVTDLAERTLGPFDRLAADTWRGVAAFHHKLGNYEQAVAAYRTIDETLILLNGERHPAVAESKHDLAQVLRMHGRYEEAERCYEAAVSIRRELTPDHKQLVHFLVRRAANLLRLGRFVEARELLQEALERVRLRGSRNTSGEATVWHQIARLHHDEGDLARAEHAYQQAIESFPSADRLAAFGGWARVHFALLLRDQGRIVESREQLVLARPPIEKIINRRLEDPQIPPYRKLGLLEVWGEFLVIAEQPGEAEIPLRACWDRRREMHAPGHWWPGYVGSLLAESLVGLERFDEAEELLLDAYPAMVTGRGADHHLTGRVVLRLIRMYEAWGRIEEAAQWRARASAERPSPVYRFFPES